ncbi:MAG: hypothetical protein IMF19_05100 [Proteobacteria bacterium]|nr:hypothetical protein [Pseudomonadota bacterium]
MNEEKKIEGKVTAWGIRLQVPAPVLKGIGLAVDDKVSWTVEEVDGKKVAVLSKKENKE